MFVFWCASSELDLSVGLLASIVHGLVSLRDFVPCVGYKSQTFLGLSGARSSRGKALELFADMTDCEPVIDFWLVVLSMVISWRLSYFKSFESMLLMALAYLNQLFMLHCCDLVSFYVCLEGQNFCFLVLSGLQSHVSSVESCLKYMLLSVFSSAMCLFWFTNLYLTTGVSSIFFGMGKNMEIFQILLAIMFKLGSAPLHFWVLHIYSGISRTLLMYVSTAPKLSLFCFWVSAWHQVWTDVTLAMLLGLSMFLGSVSAYGQPSLRALFAYSTVNEMGILMLAVEAAGFHSMYQHLGIYITTQLLLWNLGCKRLFAVCSVSLAGLPPLAGFFGKAWVFWHAVNSEQMWLLTLALVCTVVSLVYYLRVLRLFSFLPQMSSKVVKHLTGDGKLVGFTSLCVVSLSFGPAFLVKPFVF